MPVGFLFSWQSVSFDSGQGLKQGELDIHLVSLVFYFRAFERADEPFSAVVTKPT